jgi:RimJ/RimL family protein N-acetyltransferase
MTLGLASSDQFEVVRAPLIETPSLYLHHLSPGPGRTAESVLSDPKIITEHQNIANHITDYWATRYELEPNDADEYQTLMRRPESMFPLMDIARKWREYEEKLRGTDYNLPVDDQIAAVQDISKSVEWFFRPVPSANPKELLVMMNHYYLVNKYCDLARYIEELTRSDTSKLWDVVMRPEVMDNYFDTDGTQYVPLPQQLSDGGDYWTRDRTAALISNNVKSWHENGYGRWGVIEKATRRLIGMAGINTFDWLPSVTNDEAEPIEVSFRLNPDWHRRGYGTEAGRAVLEWAFNVRGSYDYIYGNAVHDNEPSLRTLAKIGMSTLVTSPYARPRTRRKEKGDELGTLFVVHGQSIEEWQSARKELQPPIISIDGSVYTT